MFKYFKRLFIPKDEHWKVDFNPKTGLNTWSKYKWGELQYTCKWYDVYIVNDGRRYF